MHQPPFAACDIQVTYTIRVTGLEFGASQIREAVQTACETKDSWGNGNCDAETGEVERCGVTVSCPAEPHIEDDRMTHVYTISVFPRNPYVGSFGMHYEIPRKVAEHIYAAHSSITSVSMAVQLTTKQEEISRLKASKSNASGLVLC